MRSSTTTSATSAWKSVACAGLRFESRHQYRHQGAASGEDLQDLQAASCPRQLWRRFRRGTGHRPADRRTPRRADLARIHMRRGHRPLLHAGAWSLPSRGCRLTQDEAEGAASARTLRLHADAARVVLDDPLHQRQSRSRGLKIPRTRVLAHTPGKQRLPRAGQARRLGEGKI